MRKVHILLVVVALLAPRTAFALSRVVRIFDQSHGLPTDTITSIAQDTVGFLWVATRGGLVRFDGAQMRRWRGAERGLDVVRAGPHGEVVVLDVSGAPLRVVETGVVAISGSDGPIEGVLDLYFDATGALWFLRDRDVLRQGSNGEWKSFPRARFANEALRLIRADGDGALVLTTAGIWSVSGPGDVQRVVALANPFDVVRRADGTFVVLAGSAVYAHGNGGWAQVLTLPARGIALAVRGASVWAGYDRFLARITPGEAPVVIGPADDLPSGGPMLVDHEGSLWVASFRGLLQYPEPDTIIWTEKDGLPTSHARFVERNGDGVWASTWAGLTRIRSDPTANPDGRIAAHIGDVCIDRRGILWFGDGQQLWTIAEGRRTLRPWSRFGRFRGCALSADGGMWLGVGADVIKTEGVQLTRVAALPFEFTGVGFVDPLLEDRTGRLWLAYLGQLCHAPIDTLMTRPAWQCEMVPGRRHVESMIEIADGTFWIATEGDGVHRYSEGRWRQIPASREVGGGNVMMLRPRKDGSVWVLSLGVPIRVVDRPDSDAGWQVVERISGWHGHPTGGASDLIEEPDGTIWTATVAGVVRIPAAARGSLSPAPRVELAGVTIDGRLVPVGQPLALTHRRNFVELRFAALTYRDRARVRYQARLSQGQNWTDLTSGEPVFRFPELAAGNYLAEVRASLDGEHWSTNGGRLAFRVEAPWYRRPWAIAVAAFAVLGILFAIHRARVAMLLNLERQRTRIAMDLHDEMGSGLGSIGILAGLAAGDRVSELQRRDLSREIADTAGELGASLGDIVWSLRRGGSTLQTLAEHLAERASRLFPGPEPTLQIEFPDEWPAALVSPAVRRNLMSICSEALHNAARHAHARRVVLGVQRRGRQWCVTVRDDGMGCDANTPTLAGMGRETMRRRAEEIGAGFEWCSKPGQGTAVEVTVDSFDG